MIGFSVLLVLISEPKLEWIVSCLGSFFQTGKVYIVLRYTFGQKKDITVLLLRGIKLSNIIINTIILKTFLLDKLATNKPHCLTEHKCK